MKDHHAKTLSDLYLGPKLTKTNTLARASEKPREPNDTSRAYLLLGARRPNPITAPAMSLGICCR